MPTWVSKRGKWVPAKEKIGLVNKSDKIIEYKGQKINPGDPFVYDGPDREALSELDKAGEEFLGVDFKDCSEFQDFINSKYQGDMGKYLKRIGYDEEKDNEKFKEVIAQYKSHEVPRMVREIKTMGGAQDPSGGGENDSIGGFGEQRERKPSELNATSSKEK